MRVPFELCEWVPLWEMCAVDNGVQRRKKSEWTAKNGALMTQTKQTNKIIAMNKRNERKKIDI